MGLSEGLGDLVIRAASRAGREAERLGRSTALQHAQAARERGNLEAAFWLYHEAWEQQPGDLDLAHDYWSVAVALDRVEVASPAAAVLVSQLAASGDVDAAARCWSELVGAMPNTLVPPTALARILPELRRQEREVEADERHRARALVRRAMRHAVHPRNEGLTPAIALRLFEEGHEANPEAARHAAQVALQSEHLHEAKRERLRGWLDGVGGAGAQTEERAASFDDTGGAGGVEDTGGAGGVEDPDATSDPTGGLDVDPQDPPGPSLETDPKQDSSADIELDPNDVSGADLEVDPDEVSNPDLELDPDEVSNPDLELDPDEVSNPDLELDPDEDSKPALESAPDGDPNPDCDSAVVSATRTAPPEPATEIPSEAAKADEAGDLVVLEAIPLALTQEALRVRAEGGREAAVAWSEIEALCVVDAGDRTLIDLIFNWRRHGAEPLRVLRLRGDRFAPDELVDPAGSTGDALQALLAEILGRSRALPLPDPESALGLRRVRFDTLESYEAQVLRSC